jgi:transposase
MSAAARCDPLRFTPCQFRDASDVAHNLRIAQSSNRRPLDETGPHLGEALDKVRKSEYARLSGKDRRFIKGHKYTLLSRRENLTLEGRQALRTLLRANKRLNTAYLLKESFDQLWSYKHEAWPRRFFDNWRASLKWQRLKPYEKFADMIDSHWAGIAAYCKPGNKVSLGFVEGLNNKIRVIQRRAYGLRDEEYLRLKVLTCTLPML